MDDKDKTIEILENTLSKFLQPLKDIPFFKEYLLAEGKILK